jgi:uncharacterized protein YqgV (UPF0045/DUF77 family)
MPETRKKEYVTYGQSGNCECGCGCGTTDASRAVTGCRFSLSVMSDRFIDVILGAIEKTDTSKVWQMTDKLSTVYRGKQVHVEDALKACFINAYREGVHMTMEATFSRGCPGDTDADCMMVEDDIPANEESIKDVHFPVACKISLYPMGITNYMEHIAKVVNHAIDLGIYEKSSHYCTILNCDVQDLFSYIHYVNEYCAKEISHYIFEVTMSVNSPTAE